jgi:hypothetical protein
LFHHKNSAFDSGPQASDGLGHQNRHRYLRRSVPMKQGTQRLVGT